MKILIQYVIPGAITCIWLVSYYLLGNKWRPAWILEAFAQVCFIIFMTWRGLYGFLPGAFAFLALDIRNWRRWGKNEARHP